MPKFTRETALASVEAQGGGRVKHEQMEAAKRRQHRERELLKALKGPDMLEALQEALWAHMVDYPGGIGGYLAKLEETSPGSVAKLLDKVIPSAPKVLEGPSQKDRDEEGVKNGKEWLDRYLREKHGK